MLELFVCKNHIVFIGVIPDENINATSSSECKYAQRIRDGPKMSPNQVRYKPSLCAFIHRVSLISGIWKSMNPNKMGLTILKITARRN